MNAFLFLLDNIFLLLQWALLLCGIVLMSVGVIGILRLPDIFSRLHAAGLTDTLGAILMVLAMMIGAAPLTMLKLLMILIFLFIAGPTATHALANAALKAGHHPHLGDQKSKSGEA